MLKELPNDVVACGDWLPQETRRFSRAELAQWAHCARRSRWPLLRTIVAESLRCVLEPQVLDALPLPTQESTLFELVCMIHMLRALSPRPTVIRWLQADLKPGNTVELPGMSYRYQYSIERKKMLDTDVFAGPLAAAMDRHGARCPQDVDGWLVFEKPLRGFHGVLVEAKSGEQESSAAIYQLRCYRAALRPTAPGPMIVWGINEKGSVEGAIRAGEKAISSAIENGTTEDLWLLTPVGAVEPLMSFLIARQQDTELSTGSSVAMGDEAWL